MHERTKSQHCAEGGYETAQLSEEAPGSAATRKAREEETAAGRTRHAEMDQPCQYNRARWILVGGILASMLMTTLLGTLGVPPFVRVWQHFEHNGGGMLHSQTTFLTVALILVPGTLEFNYRTMLYMDQRLGAELIGSRD